MPRLFATIALTVALGVTSAPDMAQAEPCTRNTLRKVVDEAGARLRVVTAETQPRIMAALRRLKEKRGWTGPEGDEKAAALMSDARTAEFDAKASTLLALATALVLHHTWRRGRPENKQTTLT